MAPLGLIWLALVVSCTTGSPTATTFNGAGTNDLGLTAVTASPSEARLETSIVNAIPIASNTNASMQPPTSGVEEDWVNGIFSNLAGVATPPNPTAAASSPPGLPSSTSSTGQQQASQTTAVDSLKEIEDLATGLWQLSESVVGFFLGSYDGVDLTHDPKDPSAIRYGNIVLHAGDQHDANGATLVVGDGRVIIDYHGADASISIPMRASDAPMDPEHPLAYVGAEPIWMSPNGDVTFKGQKLLMNGPAVTMGNVPVSLTPSGVLIGVTNPIILPLPKWKSKSNPIPGAETNKFQDTSALQANAGPSDGSQTPQVAPQGYQAGPKGNQAGPQAGPQGPQPYSTPSSNGNPTSLTASGASASIRFASVAPPSVLNLAIASSSSSPQTPNSSWSPRTGTTGAVGGSGLAATPTSQLSWHPTSALPKPTPTVEVLPPHAPYKPAFATDDLDEHGQHNRLTLGELMRAGRGEKGESLAALHKPGVLLALVLSFLAVAA